MNGSAVITDPRPSTFTASNDGPKCATDPAPIVNLSATNIPGATYYWTGPYNAHQTTSVNTTSVNGLAGTFDYTVYATFQWVYHGNSNYVGHPLPRAASDLCRR